MMQKIENFIYLFFDAAFVQQCEYAKKIELRRDSVQKALFHMGTQLNQMLDTQQLMIANISHDMRTSLNAISGYIKLVDAKNIIEGDEKNFLHKASHAASTLNGLVSDILDITKINSGQMEIRESYFWLDEIIIKCIDSVSIELNKKNIAFSAEIDLFPQQVYGDHQHILAIVINLLNNAAKYTDSGFVRFVVKRIHRLDETIQIKFQVEDTGIGIKEEQLQHIFDPYSRFNIEKQGVGLGLHIASKLAQKLGGSLSVESVFKKGSIFDFSIASKELPKSIANAHNIQICFLNNKSITNNFKQKINFLKKNGIKVYAFQKEKNFVNFLLNRKEKGLNIVSIIVDHDMYPKFDAFVNYLKTFQIFQETSFVAEETGVYISLEHFDKIYEHFTPISIYIDIFKTLNIKKDKGFSLATQSSMRILAVDDMETNLEILKMFISNKYPEIKLDVTTSGYDAISMYKLQVYDMIFLDLKMPELNGYDLLKKLKTIRPVPPSFALTADVYKSTYSKVKQAGFKGLVPKPLQPEVLYKTIRRIAHEKHYQPN